MTPAASQRNSPTVAMPDRDPDTVSTADLPPPADPAAEVAALVAPAATALDRPPSVAAAPAAVRRLHVRHDTSYAYDAPVELAHHLAYLRPRDTPRQSISCWNLDIVPPPDRAGPHADAPSAGSGLLHGSAQAGDDVSGAAAPGPVAADRLTTVLVGLHASHDAWGNWRHTFSHSVVHQRLTVVSTFSVDVHPSAALDVPASPPWESVAERLRYRPGRVDPVEREAVEFSLASSYAPRDSALRRYAEPHFTPRRPLLEAALDLMHAIHRDFEYRPQATSVATRAPAALALRQGVCQDFAHVMIGALRSLGLAARYVSGYLLTHPPAGQPRLVGADASHAWAAVWCPQHGWVALDPTNDVPVGQDHVTLAWGRDYADVAPLRGVIRGGGRAVPQVAVTVTPDGESACPISTAARADGRTDIAAQASVLAAVQTVGEACGDAERRPQAAPEANDAGRDDVSDPAQAG